MHSACIINGSVCYSTKNNLQYGVMTNDLSTEHNNLEKLKYLIQI